MTVQHGLVNTAVVAIIALKRLGSIVVSQMVFEMVLVFGNKNTFGAKEELFWFDVSYGIS